MGRFGGTVRRVSRSRSDNAGGHGQEAVNRGNRIAKSVEKQNVIDVNLCTAELVVLLHQKFTRFEHAFRRAVAVASVRLDEVNDNVLDPFGNLAFLFDRVADVFPVDGESKCLELVCLLYDFTDFVRKFLSTFAQ